MSAIHASVIIPVYNDRTGLEKCLAGLRQQTYPQECFEVLVIDNGSRESVADIVAGYGDGCRLLSEPEQGSYVARNTGIRQARGRVLAFTDADCIPEPDWLAEGIAALARCKRPGLIGGRIQVEFLPGIRKNMFSLYDYCFAFQQEKFVIRSRYAATANLFTLRDVIHQVGEFDSELMSGGDYEWGQRVHAAGLDIVYCAQATVLHPPRDTFEKHRHRMARVVQGKETRRVRYGRPAMTSLSWVSAFMPPLSRWHVAMTSDKKLSLMDRLRICTAALIIKEVRFIERIRARKKLLQQGH